MCNDRFRMILFFLLLANNVFSMEFTPLEELKLLPIDPAIVKAFSTSNASLSEFVLAWRQRTPAQKRFMVCALERRQDRLIPVGIVVDQIDETDRTFSGQILLNSLDLDDSRVIGSGAVTTECVVDWSYIDLWTLKGGLAWREFFRRGNEQVKYKVFDIQSQLFLLESPENQTDVHRQLLRSIINDDDIVHTQLLEIAPLSPVPLNAPPFSKGSMIVPYSFEIQDYVSMFGSYRLIKNLQERSWFDFDVKYPPVVNAAMFNNPGAVKAFVESGVSVNTAAYTDETLVSAAVAFGCKETVRWLLENGANVNQVDNGGRNALWGVSDLETAQWIIDAGVDLRHLTDSGRDLFSSFLEEGRFEIAQLLVDRGVGDQATLDRAKPSGTPEQRGQAIVYEDATESERADIDVRNAIDYGLVLPFRSINLRTGKIDY